MERPHFARRSRRVLRDAGDDLIVSLGGYLQALHRAEALEDPELLADLMRRAPGRYDAGTRYDVHDRVEGWAWTRYSRRTARPDSSRTWWRRLAGALRRS